MFVDLEELGSGSVKEKGFSIRGQGNISGAVEPMDLRQDTQDSGEGFSIRGHGTGVGDYGEKEDDQGDMQGNQVPPAMPKARNMWDPIEEDG